MIGYISPVDPFKDKRTWSGTYYGICKALKMTDVKIEWIPYNNNNIYSKAISKVYNFLYGKGSCTHFKLMSLYHTRSINNMNLNKYDLLFVPGQVDIVAGLKTNVPIIYYTDGTVPRMIDYYWFGFTKRAIKEAKSIEKKALDNATIDIFSSQWAADSAINDYKINPQKVRVLPFGMNMDDSLINYKAKEYSENYNSNKLNLLFSGIDWKRKGGDIAVETVKELNKRGIKATLTICGIKDSSLPSKLRDIEYIDNIGFLNKNNKFDLRRYLNIWEKTDIFILPTRAECSAIVLNEANAFGVPTLTSETGGLSDYVISGKNGELLSLQARGSDYADIIEKWLKNKKLETLSLNARNLYTHKNSWNAWSKNFALLMKTNISCQ